MKDRSAYWPVYYAANRERMEARKAVWRSVPANRKRESALDRLRYLRSKLELSEGEIEQAWEIVRKYGKRGDAVCR